jgi:hypothetical protein
MNRMTLTKIHMLLAAFIFPVALMFLVTGGFYTWGVKGSYETQVYDLSLQAPLTSDAAELTALTTSELERMDIALPSGKAKVKKGGTSYKLEWTGAARDVVLEPTTDPLVAKLTVKETTWYRNLVQLHKAKGGQLFKFYAATLASSLFIILLSGFIMALQVPRLRNMALTAAGLGVVTFIAMIAGS